MLKIVFKIYFSQFSKFLYSFSVNKLKNIEFAVPFSQAICNRMFSGKPPCRIGDAITDVETPALIVCLEKLEDNLNTMAAAMKAYPNVKFRPHAKTHKCAMLGRLQIKSGAVGLCCQKLTEAESLVQGGIEDILLSNQVITTKKLLRLAGLARSAHVAVCVDSEKNIEDISTAAKELDVVLDIVIEVNVGGNRCGVEPGEDVARLAKKIESLSNVNFKGIHCYNGQNQHIRSAADRKAAVDLVIEKTKLALGALKDSGIECRYVTGGGTGTFHYEASSGIFTEVQPPGNRAVLDAGLKAVSLDSGVPTLSGAGDLTYHSGGDEHGVIVPAGELKVGNQIWLIPGHCDPTVNMYEWIVGIRNGKVESIWPIGGRGPGI